MVETRFLTVGSRNLQKSKVKKQKNDPCDNGLVGDNRKNSCLIEIQMVT